MNKKILALLLAAAIQTPVLAGSYLDKQLKEVKKNTQYNTVQKHTAEYTFPQVVSANSIELKDPKLIHLSDVKPVDEAAYKAKIAKDEAVYKAKIKPALSKNMHSVNVQPSEVDFYNVYRIAERLIRANNLDYMNWRIAIRKSEDFNAAASNANFIYINTGLYDSLYDNPDALAFIIGHEMAHQILGHQQRKQEMLHQYDRLNPLNGESLPGYIQRKRILAASRAMEFMADAEGAQLMTRAGYNMDKGMEALNFMNALPNVETLNDTHPIAEKRIRSMMENRAAFNPEWSNEGKANIMNSDVLDCKKSSDRVSIVITQSGQPKKFYEPEALDKRILRIAYTSYKNRNMADAIKYFNKYSEISNDYVTQLYLSYANEFLYKQLNNEKYLEQATKAINKAKLLNPNDKYVIEQAAALTAL